MNTVFCQDVLAVCSSLLLLVWQVGYWEQQQPQQQQVFCKKQGTILMILQWQLHCMLLQNKENQQQAISSVMYWIVVLLIRLREFYDIWLITLLLFNFNLMIFLMYVQLFLDNHSFLNSVPFYSISLFSQLNGSVFYIPVISYFFTIHYIILLLLRFFRPKQIKRFLL